MLLDYYRFSEDLDFTWKDQKQFNGLNQNKIKKQISHHIKDLATIISNAASKHSLTFYYSKNEEKYVQLSNGGQLVTYKVWYMSSLLDKELFIKIQINFIETLEFPFSSMRINNLIKKIDKKEISFLFPGQSEVLLSSPAICCYDIKEILLEKIRAILTRKGMKARDFIDIFMILSKENIDLETLEPKIIRKILFSLKYEKYAKNLHNFDLRRSVLNRDDHLLLTKVPDGFRNFLTSFELFLNKIYNDIIGIKEKTNHKTYSKEE